MKTVFLLVSPLSALVSVRVPPGCQQRYSIMPPVGDIFGSLLTDGGHENVSRILGAGDHGVTDCEPPMVFTRVIGT